MMTEGLGVAPTLANKGASTSVNRKNTNNYDGTKKKWQTKRL